jgi:hypothetical protein
MSPNRSGLARQAIHQFGHASNAGFAPNFGRARALARQRLPELLADKRAAWFLSAVLSSSDMAGMFWISRSSAVRSSALWAEGSSWVGSVGVSPWFAASQADTGRLDRVDGHQLFTVPRGLQWSRVVFVHQQLHGAEFAGRFGAIAVSAPILRRHGELQRVHRVVEPGIQGCALLFGNGVKPIPQSPVGTALVNEWCGCQSPPDSVRHWQEQLFVALVSVVAVRSKPDSCS